MLTLDELVERFDLSGWRAATLRLDGGRGPRARLLAGCPPTTGRAGAGDRARPAPPEPVRALVPALRGVHTLAEAGELVQCVRQPEPSRCPSSAELRAATPSGWTSRGARAGRRAAPAHMPLRQARGALTGRERGPELWAVFAALPRDEAIRRAA